MDAMIRPGWRTSRPTTPFTLLYINADGRPDEHTFESLSPSARGPVSSRPWVARSLYLSFGFTEVGLDQYGEMVARIRIRDIEAQ